MSWPARYALGVVFWLAALLAAGLVLRLAWRALLIGWNLA